MALPHDSSHRGGREWEWVVPFRLSAWTPYAISPLTALPHREGGLFAGLSIFFSLVYPAWWEQLGVGNLLNIPHLNQWILCPRPARLAKAWGLEAEKSAQNPWQFFTASSLLALV